MRPVECGMVSLGSQESGSGFIRSEGEYDHSSKEADSPGLKGAEGTRIGVSQPSLFMSLIPPCPWLACEPEAS